MALDLANLGSAPLVPFSGQGWRHISPSHEPLSGEGARIHGGRFNPPSSFPVLYICLSRPCVVAELKRLGTRQAIGVEGLLPRVLYRYEIDLERVLDLTDETVRNGISLSFDVLTGPDLTVCQELGSAVHALGAQGIISPSATGVGEIFSVFVQRIGLGLVQPHFIEEWRLPSDFDSQNGS